MKTIIGLTGSYCAGKNQAASIIETMGFTVIDVDKLGHKALELCTEKLAATFGPSIIKADGSIDRRALGSIVFSKPELLHLHESIVHPVMLALLDEEIAASDRVCINAALLYRFPHAARCEFIIEIRAPLLQRIRRGKERDHLKTADILKRVMSQGSFWRQRPKGRPPVVFVDNSGSLEALKRGIEKVISQIPAPQIVPASGK